MPVRIYEIAKKFGLDSKVVLAIAKERGLIQATKTAASSIDKITAEYLEKELEALYPRKPQLETQTSQAESSPPVQEEVTAFTVPSTEAEIQLTTLEASPPEPTSTGIVLGEAESAPLTHEPEDQKTVEAQESQAVVAEPLSPQPLTVEPTAKEHPAPASALTITETQPELTTTQAQIEAQPEKVDIQPSTPTPTQPPPAEFPQAELSAPAISQQPEPTTLSTPEALVEVGSKPEPAPTQSLATPTASPPKQPGIGEKVGFIQLTPSKKPQQTQKPPLQKQQKVIPQKTGQKTLQQTTPKTQPTPGVGKPQPPKVTPVQVKQPTTEKTPLRITTPPRPSQQPPRQLPQLAPPPNAPLITMKPPIVVRDLAYKLNQKPFKIIADLMEWGIFANANQAIEEPVAKQICAKYGFRFELEKRTKVEPHTRPAVKKVELDEEDRPQDLKPRPPVVTIMGHVDHGKTTLLDKIRKSNIAQKEVGGITQHIGAYTISIPHPDKKNQLAQITFIDTPGHAAFSAMRARGANVTDIVVLVVAANEGVMPQTLEAIDHARAAGVPIIVAVNKCDHPNANPLLVRKQLQEKGLIPDEWGGDTIFVDISALTGQGVDKLLEMILLQAELMELKANPNRPAKGNVIESGIEPGGPVATLLVRKGTLHVGDFVLCGRYFGKVRALINDEGQRVKEAGPSIAVKMLGLNGPPEPGTEFMVVKDEETARKMAEERMQQAEEKVAVKPKPRVTLEELLATIEASKIKTLKLVLKADTQGSVEAISGALKQLKSDKVNLEIIHAGVGSITENDVLLAAASQGVIIGFQTKIDAAASKLAKQEGVQIKLYQIIYELIDDVRKAMLGLLEPVTREVIHGTAEVKQVFQLSKGVPVAGCVVTSGRIVKGKVRVLRNNNLIYEGVISSMRHFQDDVTEVKAGMECGIKIEGFGDYQPGDIIQSYSIEKVQQEL